MCRLTKQVKIALGIAGALLVGNTANAQEFVDFTDAVPSSFVDTGFVDAGFAQPAPAAAEDPGPWSLFKNDNFTIGGWFQGGYHTESNDLFNNQPDDFNLHQAYFFAEKVAESQDGRLGYGFRVDGIYGIDAGDTQSFGNNPGVFDLGDGFQRGGGFGWAIPQAYGEVAGQDWSVKIGHFYTLLSLIHI